MFRSVGSQTERALEVGPAMSSQSLGGSSVYAFVSDVAVEACEVGISLCRIVKPVGQTTWSSSPC